jgi:hypothetical protein
MARSTFFRRNGMSIVAFGLFLSFWVGMSIAGHVTYNEIRQAHGEPAVGYLAYLTTSHFWEATAENWESEYLEMGVWVILTARLFQKGSAESRNPDRRGFQYGGAPTCKKAGTDAHEPNEDQEVPWPERQSGWIRRLYEHSLSIAMLTLFALCWVTHLIASHDVYNADQLAHHGQPVSLVAYAGHPTFWFQAFQNWQSEFLAIGSMIVLSIFLREKNSAESKDVDASNQESGQEEG